MGELWCMQLMSQKWLFHFNIWHQFFAKFLFNRILMMRFYSDTQLVLDVIYVCTHVNPWHFCYHNFYLQLNQLMFGMKPLISDILFMYSDLRFGANIRERAAHFQGTWAIVFLCSSSSQLWWEVLNIHNFYSIHI